MKYTSWLVVPTGDSPPPTTIEQALDGEHLYLPFKSDGNELSNIARKIFTLYLGKNYPENNVDLMLRAADRSALLANILREQSMDIKLAVEKKPMPKSNTITGEVTAWADCLLDGDAVRINSTMTSYADGSYKFHCESNGEHWCGLFPSLAASIERYSFDRQVEHGDNWLSITGTDIDDDMYAVTDLMFPKGGE